MPNDPAAGLLFTLVFLTMMMGLVALLAWLDPQRLRRPRQVRASEVVAPPTVASVSNPPLAREEGGVPL